QLLDVAPAGDDDVKHARLDYGELERLQSFAPPALVKLSDRRAPPDQDDRREGHHRFAVLIGDCRLRAERADLRLRAGFALVENLPADVERVARIDRL